MHVEALRQHTIETDSKKANYAGVIILIEHRVAPLLSRMARALRRALSLGRERRPSFNFLLRNTPALTFLLQSVALPDASVMVCSVAGTIPAVTEVKMLPDAGETGDLPLPYLRSNAAPTGIESLWRRGSTLRILLSATESGVRFEGK